ncbi:MAG: hypothetical protein AAF532_13790 [Planctomycetota bacterium]
MPVRARTLVPVDLSRPGTLPPAEAGFGRDYARPLLTRRGFGRAGEAWLTGRATLPSRVPAAGSLRPPG